MHSENVRPELIAFGRSRYRPLPAIAVPSQTDGNQRLLDHRWKLEGDQDQG